MGKTFDVAEIEAQEAITVKLKSGKVLTARELTPDAVDKLGQIESKRTREEAKDDAERRQLLRVRQSETSSDEEYTKAGDALIDLTDRSVRRTRTLSYEQLASVFVDEEGNPLSVKLLQQEISLPVAQKIGQELSRQILGREDAEGNG